MTKSPHDKIPVEKMPQLPNSDKNPTRDTSMSVVVLPLQESAVLLEDPHCLVLELVDFFVYICMTIVTWLFTSFVASNDYLQYYYLQAGLQINI
jgi:hypothetical protein